MDMKKKQLTRISKNHAKKPHHLYIISIMFSLNVYGPQGPSPKFYNMSYFLLEQMQAKTTVIIHHSYDDFSAFVSEIEMFKQCKQIGQDKSLTCLL